MCCPSYITHEWTGTKHQKSIITSSAQTPRLLYMLPHPFNTFQCVLCCHTHSYRQFYRQHLPRLWNSHPSHRRHGSFHTIKYLLTTSGATLIHPYNNTHIHHFHCFMYKCVPLHSMYLPFLTHLPGSRQHLSQCHQFTLLYKLTHHFYT